MKHASRPLAVWLISDVSQDHGNEDRAAASTHRLVKAHLIFSAVISLSFLGCVADRASTKSGVLPTIALELDGAHKKLSLLRDKYDEESPVIRSQWEVIAALERRWMEEAGKEDRNLQVYDYGAAWTGAVLYELAGGHLLIANSSLRDRKSSEGATYMETRVRCLVLAQDAMEAIWGEIDRLRIHDWKEDYRPEDLKIQISDGTQWWLVLRVGTSEKKSAGNNVYPALSPFGSPTLKSDSKTGKRVPTAYHSLLEILRECDKRANKSPEPTPTAVTPRANE